MYQSLQRFVDRLHSEGIGIHTFIMRRQGEIVASGAYEPYRLEDRHMLYSLSKSFTSTAIGFAVQEGYLTVEDKLMDFFPDVLETEPCENMKKITVKHLLTMNTGHAEEPAIFDEKLQWVKAFLSSNVEHEPGTHFLYNTAATYMLSAILTTLTEESCLSYLTPRLFEPLGFESEPWWEQYADGIDTGGFGLNLSVQDISLFAEFCLNKGRCEGVQLLDAAWFDEAMTGWSDNSGGDPDNQSDWGQGYGYQFWLCKPDKVYRGDGACGQFAIMLPEQEMTIAITSGTNKMGDILTAIWEEILPDLPNPEIQVDFEDLELWVPPVEDQPTELLHFLNQAQTTLHVEQTLSENIRGLEGLRLCDDYIALKLKGGSDWSEIPLDASCWTVVEFDVGMDHWIKDVPKRSRTFGESIPGKAGVKVQAYVDKAGSHYLLIDLAFTETPWLDRWILRAEEGNLSVQMTRISGFSPLEETVFASRA